MSLHQTGEVGELRDRQRAERIASVVQATRRLLIDHDVDKITLDQIAAEAGLSSVTVWNLVGTRDDVFVTVIADFLHGFHDQLRQLDVADPIERADQAVRLSVRLFTSQADITRKLVRRFGTFEPVRTQPTDVSGIQVAAMQEAIDRGWLTDTYSSELLGQQVYVHYLGALFAWGASLADDAEFEALARRGLAVVLLAAAAPRHRARFAELMESAGQRPRRPRQRSGEAP
jgi:AcrR family transcriptional regulator